MTKELDLSQFYGTENWYHHPLFTGIHYTDGVKYVADQCEAHWLIDEIAVLYKNNFAKSYFQTFTLKVEEDKSANIIVTDGNDNLLQNLFIPFTDFPVEEITIWGVDNVLLLPGEY